jgi:protein TonB
VLAALGVSAAVHGAVVLWASLRPEPQPRAWAAVETGTPFEVFEAPAPAPRPPARTSEEKPRPVKAPRPTVAAPEPAPVTPATVDLAVAAPGAEPVAAGESEAAPPAEAPAPLTPALSPTGERERTVDLTALHAALAESARRCYPAAARRYRLAGDATVDFGLDASGGLTSTKLARSTGQSLLDDAARECVVAGALPLPPQAAGACYQVPVRFGAR